MKRLFLSLFLATITVLVMIAADGQYDKIAGGYQYLISFDTTPSGTWESTHVDSMFRLPKKMSGYSTLHATIIAAPRTQVTTTSMLTGLDDSIWLWLYTSVGMTQADSASGDLKLIDSTVSTTIPCTLKTTLHSNVGDTLLRDFLYIRWQMYDSLSDTVDGTTEPNIVTAKYPIRYDITLK